jgi:histidine triad (HIT) family protein
MPTIFSRIIDGEIPCHKVAENEHFLAFLDIRPLAQGHTLVIPKKEIDYIFDLDDADLSNMTLFAKQIAKAIEKVVPCTRIGVAVIGLEVPHAHIHLVPINHVHDLDFSRERVSLTPAQFAETAAAIAQQIVQNK